MELYEAFEGIREAFARLTVREACVAEIAGSDQYRVRLSYDGATWRDFETFGELRRHLDGR
jgi:hypothetical protein